MWLLATMMEVEKARAIRAATGAARHRPDGAAQEDLGHLGAEQRSEQDAGNRSEEEETQQSKVDVAHREVSGSRQQRQRDRMHYICAHKARGRHAQRVEVEQHHRPQGAGADRGQGDK